METLKLINLVLVILRLSVVEGQFILISETSMLFNLILIIPNLGVVEDQFILHKETSLFMEPPFPSLQVLLHNGGAIYSESGSLNIIGSYFNNCIAIQGGAIYSLGKEGPFNMKH